jgi:ABC-2 type transport system ATP-binding protein
MVDPDAPGNNATHDDWAIRTRGLTRDFGKLRAVDHVDLDVPRSRIYGFLGPNGSGKSTTIRMLCGLLTPTAGEATVLGHPIPEEAESLRSKVGYMTQNFSLYSDLTVRENLDFMAEVYALPRGRKRERIESVSASYGLERFFDQRAGTLSGGQKQRLALGAAMLHEPELLFLDEPTSAVDPENRRAFWESLFDLVEAGTTILVSTHYMDEAERCHELAILDRGRLAASGSPQALSDGIDAQVVVLRTDRPRRAGKALHAEPWVLSVAQIGNELRVLAEKDHGNAADAVAAAARDAGYPVSRCEPAPASLEDVFVAATLPARRRDQEQAA